MSEPISCQESSCQEATYCSDGLLLETLGSTLVVGEHLLFPNKVLAHRLPQKTPIPKIASHSQTGLWQRLLHEGRGLQTVQVVAHTILVFKIGGSPRLYQSLDSTRLRQGSHKSPHKIRPFVMLCPRTRPLNVGLVLRPLQNIPIPRWNLWPIVSLRVGRHAC